MRRSSFMVLALLSMAGCDGGMDPPPPGDAGRDAGREPDAGTLEADGGMPDAGADGGTMTMDCPPTTHLCGDTCVGLLPNSPSNGCALGCGDPCPGGTDAICNPDGTCGIGACEPATCESRSAECGVIDDGCGARRNCGTCDPAGGQMCMDNACVCETSADEPNDSHMGLTSRGTLNDADDPTVALDGALHSSADVDWFRYQIVDGTDGGNPGITARLSGVPAGSDYEIAIYFVCESGGDATRCIGGTTDRSVVGIGCSGVGDPDDTVRLETECSGINEHGTLYVRVTSAVWARTCGPYRVTLIVN